MDALIPTVIDTDPGIDDALALLLAWGSPELDVLALTVVAGNAPLANTARNAARLVAARRPARLPQIALGAAAPLRRALVIAKADEHGSDGLGDAVDWLPVTGPPAAPSAAETLVALARAHGERLTLIALGPLTNLALALRLDAEAMRTIGRVVVMGGAVDVPGNATPDAEFNIYVDPEAAGEVFDAGPFRVWGYMHLHDPLAVGLAVDESLARWQQARIAVGDGGQTRRAAGAPNCRVAQVIDAKRFLALFFERLCPASS